MIRFVNLLQQNGVSITQAAQMGVHAKLILEENAKYNLTAITDPEDMAKKHYLDSIRGEKLLPKDISVADIGSGAGFPGIPLKIIRPDIRLTLIEATNKKADFLRMAKATLDIDFEVVCARAEELKLTFDAVVTRAMSSLRELLEICSPLVKTGGQIIAYKGSSVMQEIEDAKNALKVLNCRITEISSSEIAGMDHYIVNIQKVGSTPAKYPRAYSKIKKHPL